MEKYQITKLNLEEERRARQEQEVNLKLERNQQYERVKYKSARDIVKQLRTNVWSWFEHWKNYTFKHKDKVRTNFKIMVITWMKRNLGFAMQQWKKSCDGMAIEMQTRAHQETMLENEELQGQIENLQREQNKRS